MIAATNLAKVIGKTRAALRASQKFIGAMWTLNVYIDASKEFVTVFVLSNMPFAWLVLSHYLNTADAPLTWATVDAVLSKNWKPGEILIYVAALLAPFAYVMVQYNRASRHMRGYWLFLILLIVLYPAASYIFAHDRLVAIKNEQFVRASALVLYGITLFVWYCGLVFQRQLEKLPRDESSDRADKIAKELGGAE